MARLVANTKDMNRAEWLELRREGLGGSDASAVAGLSKYASPIMVYMDKLGIYMPDKKAHVMEAATWGNLHEPTIRKEFQRRVNEERAEQGKQPLRIVHRQAIFAHDEHDWMRTNLDGIVYDPELGTGVFEAKTAHYMLASEWEGEDVPDAYRMQCMHNMAVMGYDYCWLAVLIGGNQFKYYFIERDQEFIDYLIAIESQFWNDHILQRIPPAMSGLDPEKDMMRDLHPQSEAREGYIVTLPNICIDLAESVDAYKQIIAELEQKKTAFENEIKAIMGSNETAFAGSHKITWKTASNGVRSMRIRLDSQEDRNKFYNARIKEVEKELKTIEKERKAIEKEAEKARKADEKARKAAEKAMEKAIKDEQKALKKLEKETGEKQDPAEYVVIDKRNLFFPLSDLRHDIEHMRENGETDLRTVLHRVESTTNIILEAAEQ